MRRLLSLVVVLSALVAMGCSGARAQDATPVAGAAATCDIEPRTADELLTLWYGDATAPDATPVSVGGSQEETTAATEITIPIGEPADAATIAAVTETVQGVFACFEAGDPLRAYALFTDDLAALFGPEPGTSRSNAEAFLAGGFGEEEDGGEESVLVAVASVMMLEDGRAVAFVVERYPAGDALSYGFFEQVGDRWLVDEIIEFPIPGGGAE